jgi:type IV pilus assembly protein PilY1
VVQVKDEKYADAANSEYDYVLMGTGWRPHPLNKTVHDRFYAFRDRTIGKMVDANQNNIADSYPAGTDPAGSAIGNGDLINVTSQVLDIDEVTHDESLGWYFDFTEAGNPGEKVLSAPITLAGTVLFTTYIPDAAVSTDLCSSQVGGGNAYNLNILNASAVIDWNADTTGVDALADRTLSLGGGIPSDVVPVFTKEGVVGIVGIEGGVAQLGAITGLPRFRTYWYEESGL